MRWEREGYLRLIICLNLKIDKSTYLFDEIRAPKWLQKAELKKVIESWENGLINWIVAPDDDVESAKQELSDLMKDKTVQLDDCQHWFVFFLTLQLQQLIMV